MKHLELISRAPMRAQGDICTGLTNDYQALLCFLYQVLQTIFPSIINAKTPTQA